MFGTVFKNQDSPQLQARILLLRIQNVKGLSLAALEKEVGVSRFTLMNFLAKEKDLYRRTTYMKVLEYIEAEKYRLGL